MENPYCDMDDRALRRRGARDCLGAPALVLGANMFAYGAFARAIEFGLIEAVLANLMIFALPGQILIMELYPQGVSILVMFLAVAAVNVRFVPMAISLMAMIKRPGLARWKLYAISHFMAVTSWINLYNRRDLLRQEQRWPYYAGFAITLYLSIVPFIVLGYLVSEALPPAASVALLMMMPFYFGCVLMEKWRDRPHLLAALLGAGIGPVLYLWSPGWSVLVTGIIGGTAAFLYERRRTGAMAEDTQNGLKSSGQSVSGLTGRKADR